MDPTTNGLAQLLGIKAENIRARLCRTGSYFGERPERLPNGRLVWKAGAYERLVNQGAMRKRGAA